MTEVTKNITVDLSRKGNTRVVFARQNDKGSRVLNIILTDGGEPYFVPSGTVATINFLRPDKENASFAATVNKSGGVNYTLGLWPLALEGSVRCSVSLYGADDTKLTSSDFYLDVLDALYSDDDFSEDFDESDMMGVYSSIASLEAKHETDMLVLEDRIAEDVDGKITAVNATASTAQSDAKEALNIANDVKARADAGEFKGDQGEKGEKGDAGVISFIPVTELPTEDIVENAIYLVPAVDGAEPDLFNEYIYTNGAWEQIGSANVSVDMSEYVKNTDYASYSNSGVVRGNGGAQFRYFFQAGTLYLQGATDEQIESRQNYVGLTPANINKIVRAGLTTNSTELTDDEKAAAQAWLGLGDIETALDSIIAIQNSLIGGESE